MKLDRRGDIGFIEAMAGAMTVCLVMLAFSSFLAADMVSSETSEARFDDSVLGSVTVENGCVVADADSLQKYYDRSSVNGIEFSIHSCGPVSVKSFDITFGTLGENSVREVYALSVKGADGSVIPLVAEVVICA